MLNVVKILRMLPRGEVGCRALNDHGNLIIDHGKSWKNHGILFLNFCGNPDTHNESSKVLLVKPEGRIVLCAKG